MYVIRKEIIKSNIRSIREEFYNRGIPLLLCYSYKTNMMPEVVSIMSENGVCPEVVSRYEYEHIPENDRRKARIVCNGVAMSYEELALRVVTGDIVNFNDIESLVRVRKIIGKGSRYNIGLRIRFDMSSRFGVHVDDLQDALKKIDELNFSLECLHCHVTGTRELSKYKQKVSAMIDAILNNKIKPMIIDFGGSMYGNMSELLASKFNDVGSFNDYVDIIASELKRLNYQPCIALELGTALIANAIDVVGNVIRIDEYGRVVLDVDKYTVGMVRQKALEYTIIHSEDVKMRIRRLFKVYGCTCIEDDLLIDELNCELGIGDSIVFHNCGAYSYCFEPDFIIPKQEVIVK